jgi:hypothetical protein
LMGWWHFLFLEKRSSIGFYSVLDMKWHLVFRQWKVPRRNSKKFRMSLVLIPVLTTYVLCGATCRKS